MTCGRETVGASLADELKGGQIFDNAICGEGGTVPLSDAALAQVKAGIFLGDPHYTADLAYGVGDCQASGVSPKSRS